MKVYDMKKLFSIWSLLIVSGLFAAVAANGIGTWRAYMAYHDITDVVKGGNQLYVLASDNLYSYNTNDHSLQTYDKVNALSDCSIDRIAWNQSAGRLVIVYANNNIDLLDGKGEVTNISDYYNKSMTNDKTIYSIDMAGIYAYLATGFGIVKLNVRDAEISDTYQLGFRVDYTYIENNNIFAASSTNGLYRAALADNLLDQGNWKRVGEYAARPYQVDADLMAVAETLLPGGPKYNYFGFMRFHGDKLFTCGGATDIPATIQIWNQDDWTIYPDEGISQKTGVAYTNLSCLDIDPNNENHLFAGGRNGLYEYKNGQFVKHYNDANSPIESFNLADKEYELLTGVKFDRQGNLWCLNSLGTSQGILEYTTDQQWKTFSPPSLMRHTGNRALPNLTSLMEDSRQLLWFVNDNYISPSLHCYQPSTGAMASYYTFINEDGTQLSTLQMARCVAEDRDGNIWVGTNVGPLMLEASNVGVDPDDVLFNQVKVPRNDGTNLADYLLSGVDVISMAVDAANRKWFGTNGLGVYLIDQDNITEIHHFTANNSKLLSNYVASIAINSTTGEVFFGTDKGLCSYMSDATATNDDMNDDNVWAYPNPVRPGYTGLITVTGLSYQADVKIVTTNGVLVAKGYSNGGTFTWDGCDLNGKRVASGVYMVETATQDGGSGTVCKIAVVN